LDFLYLVVFSLLMLKRSPCRMPAAYRALFELLLPKKSGAGGRELLKDRKVAGHIGKSIKT
jgi:hypothetical protein